MRRDGRVLRFAASTAIACGGPSAARAWACSVCGGDPASPLTQGALSGVLFMAILTYVVVVGLAAVPLVWALRSRRLRRRESDGGEVEAGNDNS